ncbi:hypothetical protein YC2023_029101 [Brassica napus]
MADITSSSVGFLALGTLPTVFLVPRTLPTPAAARSATSAAAQFGHVTNR